MLKCPTCGRTGGPFRLRQQVQADGQILRAWACPCGNTFHATAEADRSPAVGLPYTGFTIDWNDRPQTVRLQRIVKNETTWSLGPWTIVVAGPPIGPGARTVFLYDDGPDSVGEWRIEPGWGAGEISRRIKASPPTIGLHPDLLARVFVRLVN
ncbi:MAG: hypothetical protein ACM3XM_01485 [Mycobacterium leprae]